MPEPLVHDTGVFVFAHVQAVETSVGKTLCPKRLLRQLRNWRRHWRAKSSNPDFKPIRRTAMIQASLFLRRAFLLDTIASGMMAVLLTFGAAELAPLLGLPVDLLRETGLFLIAYTALVGWLATRQSMPKALVIIVIAGNTAWAIASIALLFSKRGDAEPAGPDLYSGQAIVPGALAELQYIGLRRSSDARWRLSAG